MKIKIQVFGFEKEKFPPEVQGDSFELSLENPISLHSLLDTVLHIHTLENGLLINGEYYFFLINGTYYPPNYSLQDGDVVQILPMLDAG